MASVTTSPLAFAGSRFGLSLRELAKKYGLTEDQPETKYTEIKTTQPTKANKFLSSYLGEAKYSGKEIQKAIAESERKAVTEREGFADYDSGYLGKGVSGAQISADTGRQFINLNNVLYPELVQNKTRSIEQIGKYKGFSEFTKLTGSIGKAGIERAAAHLNISPQEAAKKAQAQGTTLGPKAASAYGSSPTIESIGKQEAQPQYQQMTGSIGKAGIERAAAELGISPQEAARRAQAQGTTLGPAAKALIS